MPDINNPEKIIAMIDHTLLKPDATPAQIAQLCSEALEYHFASVCVNPANVRQCAFLLAGSAVKVCSVVGFPLGATLPEVKAYESRLVIEQGASEIDMVINIGALKSGNLVLVEEDISQVVRVCHASNALVKVIIETALLNEEEKISACQAAKRAGADFVKTSTGFSSAGATVEDVALMRKVVGQEMGVKASGGVRSLEDALNMVSAGATRLGTSSGVKIAQSILST